jgi:hypothetical protein
MDYAALLKLQDIRFSCGLAEITVIDSFQTEEGEPVTYGKVKMGGALIPLSGTPEELTKLRPNVGKPVSVTGRLEVQPSKTGFTTRFHVEECKELK